MFEPLVSIIIPVYNGSDYMREAIESALSQTYKNKEIIVVNDGSKDDGATDEIARSFGDRIRYIPKENGGVSSALNVGIKAMKGEYFSWLSHDDSYMTDKIEKQVSILEKLDKNTIVSCLQMQMDENSVPRAGYSPTPPFEPFKVLDSKDVLKGLLQRTTLNGCCLLIPKGVFEKAGYFDETLRFCQDAFMWYNVFLNGFSLYFTDDVSVNLRVHSNQLTQRGQALFRKECGLASLVFADKFAEASTNDYNFLKMYLLSDARHIKLYQMKNIIEVGKKKQLLSTADVIKGYVVFGYGKIRPFVRRIYYKIFKRVNTK